MSFISDAVESIFGGGKDAPPAPDYAGAAQATANSSKEVTNINNYANRPTIKTPFGNQSWTTEKVIDPATGQEVTAWTQNTSLTPQSQAALNSQLAMQQGRSDLANSLMPQAQEAVTKPIDYDSFSALGTTPTASNFENLSSAGRGNNPFNYSTQPIQQQIDISNVSKLGDFDRAFVGDMFNQTMDYMRPDMERAQSSLETKLVNQGLTRGSEAYNNAYRQMMDQQSRDKYNALATAYNQGNQMYQNQLAANAQTYGQAANNAAFANAAQNQSFGQQNTAWNNNFNLNNQMFNQDLQQATFNNQNRQNEFAQQQNIANYQNVLRQQQIAEAQQRQLQPLNNINALMTGQQVGMPQMPSFNANQAAQPVNYLGAAQAQGNYNMQQQQMDNASANSAMSGAFGLGGSLLGAAGKAGSIGALFSMSDKRLKTNIKKIMDIKVNGKTLGWYRYNYLGSDVPYEGVLAQEVEKVKPEAVKRHANGYRMVNYSMLGA